MIGGIIATVIRELQRMSASSPSRIEKPSLDYLDQVDVAMLAPSRAGKSTLICAMKKEFQAHIPEGMRFTACADDNIWDYWKTVTGREPNQPATSTIAHMKTIEGQYKSTLACPGLRFRALGMGTRESTLLTFTINDQKSGITMPFRILDYPGGAVDSDQADEHTKVLDEYAQNSFALVVPVFSLALVEMAKLDMKFEKGLICQSEYLKQNHALSELLQVDSVVRQVARWCWARARVRRHGVLIFAPVKCEAYFSDNADKGDLAILNEMTRRLYFGELCNVLSSYNEELQGDINRLISVWYSPVQTYGSTVIEGGTFEWSSIAITDGKAEEAFIDTYKKVDEKTMAPVPMGAGWIIHHVIKKRNELLAEMEQKEGVSLQQMIDNQGFFSRLWGGVTGANDRDLKRIAHLYDHAEEYKDIIRKFAVMNGCDAIANRTDIWPWAFSTVNH